KFRCACTRLARQPKQGNPNQESSVKQRPLANIDANLNVAGDQAFSFIGTNAFSAAGQVRFFQDGAGNTIVEGNIDGNPGADFQIELHAFAAQLQASDFLL